MPASEATLHLVFIERGGSWRIVDSLQGGIDALLSSDGDGGLLQLQEGGPDGYTIQVYRNGTNLDACVGAPNMTIGRPGRLGEFLGED